MLTAVAQFGGKAMAYAVKTAPVTVPVAKEIGKRLLVNSSIVAIPAVIVGTAARIKTPRPVHTAEPEPVDTTGAEKAARRTTVAVVNVGRTIKRVAVKVALNTAWTVKVVATAIGREWKLVSLLSISPAFYAINPWVGFAYSICTLVWVVNEIFRDFRIVRREAEQAAAATEPVDETPSAPVNVEDMLDEETQTAFAKIVGEELIRRPGATGRKMARQYGGDHPERLDEIETSLRRAMHDAGIEPRVQDQVMRGFQAEREGIEGRTEPLM